MRKEATSLALVGALLFVAHHHAALGGWYLREDCRFFANGIFSLWDMVRVFLTPQNYMGHYRPITKLLWGIPEWLGIASPLLYHVESQLLLAAGAIMLARLSWLLFGDALFAVASAVFWSLMPTHTLSIYWFASVQNLTAALFVFTMLVCRIQQWKKPANEKAYRALCLFCLAGALFSREVGFASSLLLFAVDAHFKKLRRSYDVALILVPMVLLVFVVDPPFHHAGVKWTLPGFSELWDYALATPWSVGHSRIREYPLWAQILSAMLLLVAAIGPFFRRSFALATLLMLAGVMPFLIIHFFALEYGFLFGAGLALLAGGALSMIPWRNWSRPLAALTLALLFGGYTLYLGEQQRIFKELFLENSLGLEQFVSELTRFTRTLPAHRAIEITGLGPYNQTRTQTAHFLPMGFNQLLQDRVILISPAVIDLQEGTKPRDPGYWLWQYTYSNLEAPIRIHYGAKGFERD